jgi:hypothetical protein
MIERLAADIRRDFVEMKDLSAIPKIYESVRRDFHPASQIVQQLVAQAAWFPRRTGRRLNQNPLHRAAPRRFVCRRVLLCGYDGWGNLLSKTVTKGTATAMSVTADPATNRIFWTVV